MLLQTLLGAWPDELMDGDAETAVEPFRQRIEDYARKALREAKRHTSWVNVNEPYEAATFAFIATASAAGRRLPRRLPAARPAARLSGHAHRARPHGPEMHGARRS